MQRFFTLAQAEKLLPQVEPAVREAIARKREYDQAEAEFVPSFTDLAQRFIGLDLDIRLETPQNLGVAILLEVKSSARRQFHQLSESQRFFIDMALRMAMIKYMSALDSKGSFYVDTPEGSLDVE